VVVVTSLNKKLVSLESICSCKILVATSCAATGIDLESVTEVVIVGLPYSIEQIIQWAGRCRGDGNITVIVPQAHMTPRTELSGNRHVIRLPALSGHLTLSAYV